MPLEGYTAMVANTLDHPNITVYLNSGFDSSQLADYDHVFYSGTR